MHDTEPFAVINRSWLCHRLAVFAPSTGSLELPLAHLNELSTTPDNTNGEHCFTITHPFHPLCGHTFPLLSQRFAWGEERVFFSDQETHEVRSLPLAWTNLSLPDPFLVVAAGKAVLRWKDLQQLTQFLRQQQSHSQEGH
jgi:Family of unknown function (DUF5372)